MARYVEKAVEGLRSYFSANFQTHLTATETANGLSAGALPPPKAYLNFDSEGDNRSPLVCVFEESFQPEDASGGQRNRIWTVPCIVRIEYSSGPDVGAAATLVRRYLEAMIRTVLADTRLAGEAIQAVITGADPSIVRTPGSTTRHTYTLSCEVSVEG